jgi:hypothetical protein
LSTKKENSNTLDTGVTSTDHWHGLWDQVSEIGGWTRSILSLGISSTSCTEEGRAAFLKTAWTAAPLREIELAKALNIGSDELENKLRSYTISKARNPKPLEQYQTELALGLPTNNVNFIASMKEGWIKKIWEGGCDSRIYFPVQWTGAKGSDPTKCASNFSVSSCDRLTSPDISCSPTSWSFKNSGRVIQRE